jgi:hypothetical protein
MTRQEIERDYRVEGGIIRSPGKFESEPVFAPYFWDVLMNGGADDDVDGIAVFAVNADDIREFPELEGTASVRIPENDQGFVSCWQEN